MFLRRSRRAKRALQNQGYINEINFGGTNRRTGPIEFGPTESM